jgi:hypothetical protein
VWTLVLEWDNAYDEWKITTFASIKPVEMEYECQNFFKKITKWSKDLKVGHTYLAQMSPYTSP